MSASNHLSTGFLVMSCLALGSVVVFEMMGDVSLAPQVTAAAPTVPALPEREPVSFEPPDPEAFEVIGERPLFSPSRLPFVPPTTSEPVVEPDQPPPEPLLAELVGVVLTADQRAAMVQEEGAPAPRRVTVGQSVAGWRVVEVERSRAVFRRGDEVQVLELRRD
jgi:hypothetical protein